MKEILIWSAIRHSKKKQTADGGVAIWKMEYYLSLYVDADADADEVDKAWWKSTNQVSPLIQICRYEYRYAPAAVLVPTPESAPFDVLCPRRSLRWRRNCGFQWSDVTRLREIFSDVSNATYILIKWDKPGNMGCGAPPPPRSAYGSWRQRLNVVTLITLPTGTLRVSVATLRPCPLSTINHPTATSAHSLFPKLYATQQKRPMIYDTTPNSAIDMILANIAKTKTVGVFCLLPSATRLPLTLP